MNAAEITALATGIPAIVGAITALVWAIRGKATATQAQALAIHTNTALADHVIKQHNAFPIQPPSSQEPPIQ